MKLQELGAQRPTEQFSRVIENQSGKRIDFAALGKSQAASMLRKVQGLLTEHRRQANFHHSEKNPAYLQLMLMEQGLASCMQEQEMTGQDQQRVQATTAATAQLRRRQMQELIKAKQQEIAALQRQMSSPTLGLQENRRLTESELQQAQVVLAAQDMIDRVQGMLEDVSEMQFKDLPALADSIKNDMGTEQATQFQQQASQALSTLLQAMQAGKTELESAQGVLTGTAPVVPGQDTDLGEPGAASDTDDLDLSLDANLPDTGEEDEEEEVTVGLGRERR